MWTGFLYGQQMWTRRTGSSIEDDFRALCAVYKFAMAYDHYFAQDAALDASRVIIHHHRDALRNLIHLLADLLSQAMRQEKPNRLVGMLMDLTVHGHFAEEFRLWADSDNDCESENATELGVAVLAKSRFKAQNERVGLDPPDLMSECAYHSHGSRGRSRICYLG